MAEIESLTPRGGVLEAGFREVGSREVPSLWCVI